MIRVGIVGATGYAGAELVRILHTHPKADLTIITSRQYAGKPVSNVYPAFKGVVDIVCVVDDVIDVHDYNYKVINDQKVLDVKIKVDNLL